MYDHVAGEDRDRTAMRIDPAGHHCMGGLWVDDHLMSNVPGLFVLGEANFSDHGANRLGASALMQGLADGYFIAPYSVGNYIGGEKLAAVKTDGDAFRRTIADAKAGIDKMMKIRGRHTVDEIHR